MAEHWFCKPEVVGSNPTASFPCRNDCPDQAQRHAADDLTLPRRKKDPEFRCGRSPESVDFCRGFPFNARWTELVTSWVGLDVNAPGLTNRMVLAGQMAGRPMAPDCKSGGLSPTQVRILLCPFAFDTHRL